MDIDTKYYESLLPNEVPQSLDDLDPGLRMFKDDRIECWYAPVGHINKEASIALFGLTPGWTQMKMAYKVALTSAHRHGSKKVRRSGMSAIAFAGTMRSNLIQMMDDLNLGSHFGVSSFADLFGTRHLAYSSVLKYPVFSSGRNYSGRSPDLLSHPFLRSMLETELTSELQRLTRCLIIPLGKKAEEGISFVQDSINPNSIEILNGFPHPSGANAHRVGQFCENRENLHRQINEWFKTKDREVVN